MTGRMDKLNVSIRNTIGDLIVQNLMLNAQLEEATARIAELESGSHTNGRDNSGHVFHPNAHPG